MTAQAICSGAKQLPPRIFFAGYGDQVATSTSGRMFVVIILLLSISLIPLQSSKLAEAWKVIEA